MKLSKSQYRDRIEIAIIALMLAAVLGCVGYVGFEIIVKLIEKL